jgi:SulP family sulfate permease
VGCIGGVGFFLLQTGIEISAQVDESVGIDIGIIQHLFDNEVLPLWVGFSPRFLRHLV